MRLTDFLEELLQYSNHDLKVVKIAEAFTLYPKDGHLILLQGYRMPSLRCLVARDPDRVGLSQPWDDHFIVYAGAAKGLFDRLNLKKLELL